MIYTTQIPVIGAGNAGLVGLFAAILGGVVLTVVAVAAVLILVRPKRERGSAIVTYGVGVIGGLVVSWIREDWWIFAVVVLMLPAMLAVRWLYRRVGDRQRS